MSGRISTIFGRPGILQEPAKKVFKAEGLRFGVRARGRCRKRRVASSRRGVWDGGPGVGLGTARLRYTSQRLIALDVGNKAVPLPHLGGHAGAEVLEA
jgi:hypothetical protein